jgi:hypothetical protein
MRPLRLFAVILLVGIGTADLFYRHTFEFFFMAAGALCGKLLWNSYGRRGRRGMLLAVGIPVALALGGLDPLAQSLAFPHSFHSVHRATDAILPVPVWLTGPFWLLVNLFVAWLLNPKPGAESVPGAHRA